MPRPAKQEVAQNETDENILHEPVEITYPEPEVEDDEPPVLVKTRKYEEWTEKRKPGRPRKNPEAETVVQVVEAAEEDQEGELPIDRLLESMSGGDHSIALAIWELPNYHKDRISSMRAEKIFCGNIPLPPTLSDESSLISLVQENFALPGKDVYYFLAVAKENGVMRHNLGVIKVKGMTHAQAAQNPALMPASVQLPPALDPIAQLQGSMKLFKQISEIVAPNIAQAPIVPQLPPESQSEESAFLTLLKTDPERIDALRKRIFGGGDGASSSDGWADVIKLGLPIAAQILTQFMAQRSQAPAQGPPQNAGFGAPAEAPNPAGFQQATYQPEDLLFADIWRAAHETAPVNLFAQHLYRIEDLNEELQPYIDAFMAFPTTTQAAQFVRRNAPGVPSNAPLEPILLWVERLREQIANDQKAEEAEGEGAPT